MAYPPISALPTPPSRQDPTNFANEADAFLGAIPTFQTETNAAGTYIDGKAAEVDTDAATAEAAKNAAIAAAAATAWVSGASYSAGDVVWSLVDYQTYRAKTTHSGLSTDPSSDSTNWAQISTSVIPDNALLNVAQTFTANQTISAELKVNSYNETYVAVTSTAAATTVNCEAGNTFSHVLTESTTFTFSNPPASGTAYTMSIEIVQDAGASGYTVTWPASVDFPAATAPTLTATASAIDVFVFTTKDGGTNWYGFTAGQAIATPA
mgnify:CR=1 FL=1|tara:strand:- start:997 stop:1794 length:798 start_codon:yes stop_codon:yes gene_type:complete